MKTRPWIGVSELNSPNSPDAMNAILAASSVLFALSGQKYGGEQRITEHYVCEPSGAPVGCVWDPGLMGYRNPRTGINTYIPLRGPDRSLATGKRFRLRERPVQRVESVSIGGEVQDPSTYSLVDNSMLETTGAWSLCGGEGPTVTYTFGIDPPPLGVLAARRLANEFLAALNGGECALPTGVTSVTRQGLSLEIFDPQDFFDKGHTGLYEVDLFVATVNPGKAKKRPRVFSPDVPRGYRRS